MNENKQAEPVDYVVSAVLVKQIPTGVNTQNKLYAVNASNKEEAHGIVLGMLGADFPEHQLHTMCSYPIAHPAPAVAQEPVVFAGDALRWALSECGVNQTDNGVHFPESALAKLAAILARAYTNKVLAQKTESVTFSNDAAWDLAQKVRIDLDRKACPSVFMDLAMESINRHYTHLAPAVAHEAVHFRAVLCREQQDQAIGVVPKVVGFVDKKAAEQFILEKRDFQGWRYNLEPLYTEAPAVAVNERMLEALRDFSNYVRTEQSSTDGHVQYSNTQINRLAFKARSAIAAAEAAKGGV